MIFNKAKIILVMLFSVFLLEYDERSGVAFGILF